MKNQEAAPAAVSPALPVLLALGVFIQMLDATILNTALPSMAADLRESPLQMQSAVIAYALTLALLMPLSGYLFDRYGGKRVFAGAMLVFVAGSVLCAAAPTLNMLVVGRVVQGMGGAMLAPVPRMVIMRAYDKSRLVSMMNYVVMPALIGPVVGPIAGGYLVQYLSWHWIFLINVPFGLAAAAWCWRIMPDLRQENMNKHFDLIGFLLFGCGSVGLTLAVEIMNHPQGKLFSLLTLLFSLTALALYWRHSKYDPAPIYGRDLLQVRTFRIGLSGNLVSRLGMGALPFMLPLMLQVGYGRSAIEAGWALAPVALASIAAKPLIQPLMRRFGYRRLLIGNTWLIGLVIVSFALTSRSMPTWWLLPQLVLLGICNSIQFTGMNTLTLADLSRAQAGSGSSLMTVNQQLSIGFGIALGAALLHYLSHAPWFGGNIEAAFHWTFVGLGLMTLLSSLIFARLHREDGENLVVREKG